ncbi:glycoside hydrolase family 38 N-terminal domain-containing protein [Phytoactinopolyspora halotolerans]|uniref:Alpha-mannosidase n=1 Tax=Phytoactinopolyspora halotolerans TaxID=1981512 RepID=A0A6L9SG04_9ACTN|nr:glycoside hydrolase family 38 C-terminal domain-containing protein [Phytoactinopolyspora halotolerans]NEE04206.1 alpha-mannosidase [Phytoactinopolyspora halotolerans]
MTTRALVKDHPWSADKARSGLIRLAVAAEEVLGGRRIRLLPEPLLRRTDDGTMLQSVRILGDGDGETGLGNRGIGDVVVRMSSSGTALKAETLPGPGGTTRLLVPAVSSPTQVTVELPRLAADRRITVELLPVREWSVHLVHHSHLDIGYTDPQGTVLGEHVSFLDSCLDLTRATRDWPEPAQFRWAVESLWSFEQWMAARPAERVDEFLERVRDGHIELTAMPYNLHTDTCSTDELHELLRLARHVRRRYGVQMPVAMQTDVPGTVAGLPDALAQLDVRYLSVAHNWAGRSVPHLNGGHNLPRLFRWRSLAGNSVLVWMTDSPHGLAYMEGPVLGFSTSYDMVDDLLPAYLTSLATNPYPFPPGMFGWHGPAVTDREPYPWDVIHLRVQGHFSDNAPPRLIHSDIVRRWNETWAFPQLRLSTNADFFRQAEQRVGSRIPTFTGDWGDWWVEGVGSGARPQAMTRRAQALVTDAQTVSSMSRMLAGQGLHDEHEHSSRVYSSISLFNEHTWGASDPWTDGDTGRSSGEQQWHWKYTRAITAHDDAEVFLDHATARFGAHLRETPDADATYYAVNTAGFARSSTVSLFVRESKIPLHVPVTVRDSRTGDALPCETIPQTNPSTRDAGRFFRVHVPSVPAVGAARLTVHASAPDPDAAGPEPGTQPVAEDPLVLENEHLRVRVDLQNSCVASIVDKATGREIVDQAAVVGMNAYVYDTYTTAGGYNHQSNKTSVSEELELLGSRTLARPSALLEQTSTPTEERLTYEFAADGVRWARVTLVLPRDAAHLEIENRLSKPATMTKESAYFAFPFAVPEPTVRYEITGGTTGPGLPHVPGAPQHMRAVRNWVSFEHDDIAVAWVTRDAPLVHPEVVPLPYAPFPDSMSPRQPATVYSWVHNNVWDTNFPSQQGFETSFRYAIGVRRAGEQVSATALAMRTAVELTNPVIGVLATGEHADTGALDHAERSLFQLDDDRVRLVSVTAATDIPAAPGVNAACLVKLQSYAEEPVTVRLRLGIEVTGAATATYLGDRLEDLEVTGDGIDVFLPPHGAVAVLLDGERSGHR